MKRGKSSSSCEEEEDRISNLPDELIQHILSFIHTKYAVQTCVLSKRWRYIWTSLPELDFYDGIHCCDVKFEDRNETLDQAIKRLIHRAESDRSPKQAQTTKRLIHHVQSFMHTKYAGQTCVLSTRSRSLWNSMHNLDFCDGVDSCEDRIPKQVEATKGFVKFVNEVLSLRDKSDILRLHLEISHCYVADGELGRFIDQCVATAVSHNVQDLCIKATATVYADEYFEIPLCLGTCQSLTKLELDLCIPTDFYGEVILPCDMSLPRLKSLHIRLANLYFTDAKLTNRFFSSFPTLESLVIVFTADRAEYGGLSGINLELNLPALKHFSYISIEEDNDRLEEGCNSKVRLHAPSLSSFIFDGYMSTSFTLKNLSSLVTADIEININHMDQDSEPDSVIYEEGIELYARRYMRFFRGLRKVKVLKLRPYFIKALGGAPHTLDNQLKFCNLRCLELWTYLSRDCLHSIFYILKISPKIESVSLQILQPLYFRDPQAYPCCDEVKFDPENIGDYWDAGLSMSCMICHLKYVEIKGLLGRVNELKFLEILLKHAAVLEKVVLSSCSTEEEDSQREKRMTKFTEILLTFPTASKKILILFKF